jgi:hypothetical protein
MCKCFPRSRPAIVVACGRARLRGSGLKIGCSEQEETPGEGLEHVGFACFELKVPNLAKTALGGSDALWMMTVAILPRAHQATAHPVPVVMFLDLAGDWRLPQRQRYGPLLLPNPTGGSDGFLHPFVTFLIRWR